MRALMIVMALLTALTAEATNVQTVLPLVGPDPRLSGVGVLYGNAALSYATVGAAPNAAGQYLLATNTSLAAFIVWHVIWVPGSLSSAQGIQLWDATHGQEISSVTNTTGSTLAITNDVVVTTSVNASVALGSDVLLLTRTKGDGVAGPKVLVSRLEMAYPDSTGVDGTRMATNTQLFGPYPSNSSGALLVPSTTLVQPGDVPAVDCLTIHASQQLSPVKYALFSWIWWLTPTPPTIRLTNTTDNTVVVQTTADDITCSTGAAVGWNTSNPCTLDITAPLNAIISGGVDKVICFSASNTILYEPYLRMIWN